MTKRGVTTEQLVAADTRDSNLEARAIRGFGDQVGVDSVDRRLIHRIDRVMDATADLLDVEADLVMLAFRRDGQRSAASGAFVEGRIVVEASVTVSIGRPWTSISRATSETESTPPERKAPTGTSAIK